jgi:hypothetical protein
VRRLTIIAIALLWLGCKSEPPATGDGGNGGSGDASLIDAVLPPGCTGPEPSRPQCSNCIDDDGDGAIDSLDLECTMPIDQDEASFGDGIPTDIVDPVHPDCFFDGNTRSTDDGCQIHVCCLLGAASRTQCPIGASQYNPNQCPPPIGNTPLSQTCIDTCGPLTLPGCDCFGCCTICDPATDQCHDVELDPDTSPGCEPKNIADPNLCKRCTKVAGCGHPTCGGTSCILCPGEDPSDLPASCSGTPACPAGTTSCANGAACPQGTYCHAASQCCIGAISL